MKQNYEKMSIEYFLEKGEYDVDILQLTEIMNALEQLIERLEEAKIHAASAYVDQAFTVCRQELRRIKRQ